MKVVGRGMRVQLLFACMALNAVLSKPPLLLLYNECGRENGQEKD